MRWWQRSALRERIYIVFSLSGVVYVIFVIALFVAARFRTGGGGLPWVLGVALIVVGLVGIIQTNDNLSGVELEALECEPSPEGSEAFARVLLSNRSSRDRCALLLRFAGRKGWRLRSRVALLRAGGMASVCIPLSQASRGVYPLPTLVVWSLFPFGLGVAWKRFDAGVARIVYPRPEGSLAIGSGDEGNAVGARSEAGIEDVSGHRPYEAGDSPRRVDWRHFARRRELHVRVREDPSRAEVVLRFCDTAALGDTETRLRQMSRWIDDCLARGWRFRMELGSRRVLDGERACREALARFEEEA